MTDSGTDRRGLAGGPKLGKRERLVAGARQMMHRQGVEKTRLADIAQAADVPVGNVYYYFKTKDELVAAVIEAHARDLQAAIASFDQHPTPQARLKAFIAMVAEQRDVAAAYGCPEGTLCSELDRRDDDLARAASTLMRNVIDWAQRQFAAMGRDDAAELAVALMASYQGISLLANTFRDAELITREARRLERWIDSLADAAPDGSG